jgi:hypothetical protein
VDGDIRMSILDERFRDCICLSTYNRIENMQMLGELTMIERAKSLERRIR